MTRESLEGVSENPVVGEGHTAGEICDTIKLNDEINDFLYITEDIFENGIGRNALGTLGVKAFTIKNCLNIDLKNDANQNDLYSKLSQLGDYINNFKDTSDYRLKIINKIGESKELLERLIDKK